MKQLIKHPAAIISFLLFIAVTVYMGIGDNAQTIVVWLQSQPISILLCLTLCLPLVGLPLSLLWVVIGATLPLMWALPFAIILLAVHHALVLVLSKTRVSIWLIDALRRKNGFSFDRSQHTRFDDLLFIFTVTWIPGPTYIFKVAATALAGVRMHRFFVFGVLSQLTSALPYLLLGRVAEHGSMAWISLGVFAATALTWSLTKLAKHLRSTSRLSRKVAIKEL